MLLNQMTDFRIITECIDEIGYSLFGITMLRTIVSKFHCPRVSAITTCVGFTHRLHLDISLSLSHHYFHHVFTLRTNQCISH